MKLKKTSGFREVDFSEWSEARQPMPNDLEKSIWVETCKVFPLNRCYVFFLQEKMPKRSVGTV